MSACKITRRGFKSRNTPVPADVLEQAEEFIAAERAYGAQNILAQLRPMTYCGPGSAGERGAYMLDLHAGRHGTFTHGLHTIERSGSEAA